MSLTAKATEVPGTVDCTVVFTDAEGNPAKVDGVPEWSASDTNIIDSIEPHDDGMGAKFHLTNNVGASQLTVRVKVGGNDTDFVDTVSIVAGDAVVADFAFSGVTPDA